MNIIYNGISFDPTSYTYFAFISSTQNLVYPSIDNKSLIIEFIPGTNSNTIAPLLPNSSVIENKIIQSTKYIKIETPSIFVNGCLLRRVVQNDYTIEQYLVQDIPTTFVETENSLKLLINSETTSASYITLLSNLKYIKLISNITVSLKNFQIRIVENRPTVNPTFSNNFVYNTKEFYEDYLVREIDVLASFIQLLIDYFKPQGISIFTKTANDNPESQNYIEYKLSDRPIQVYKKSTGDPLENAVEYMSTIEFTLNTPNYIVLNDFRWKYLNIKSINTIGSSTTLDSEGDTWDYSIKWSAISNDFDYNTRISNESDKNNFSASFSCELNYYVVKNVVYNLIQNYILTIIDENEAQLPIEVYIAPTAYLFDINGNTLLVEVGTVIPVNIHTIFNQNDAGSIISQNITRDNVVVTNNSSYDSLITVNTDTEFKALINYAAGPIDPNKTGTPIPAGTLITNSIIYKTVRYLFYGFNYSLGIRNLGNIVQDPNDGDTFTITIPLGAVEVVFAYPENLRDVFSVLYIELGNIEVKEIFTKTIELVPDASGGNPINYKVFRYTPVEPYPKSVNYSVKI